VILSFPVPVLPGSNDKYFGIHLTSLCVVAAY